MPPFCALPEGLTRVEMDFSNYVSQSTDEEIAPASEPEINAQTQYGTTTFADRDTGFHIDGSETDPTRATTDTPDVDLKKWFERPVQIANISWDPGLDLDVKLSPWTLFFRNKRTINRATNFRNFRGSLKVKFIVVGTPFHYGRTMVSYNPLNTVSDIPTARVGVDEDLVGASQRPHVMLNPAENQGAELTLPFYYYKDNVDMIQSEYSLLGELWLKSFGVLRHALAGTNSVFISVYASMEDMELNVPTIKSSLDLIPQAADEYADGPVSSRATAVANFASSMTKVPYIGLYARATEIGASAVSTVAKMFGYSRPRIVENETPVMPRYVGNVANVNAGDTAQTTALDIKQELSLSPQRHGLKGVDQMAFQNIVCIPSYVRSVNWTDAFVPDQAICSIPVTPDQFARATGSPNEYHLTACAGIAQCFRFWRGTMRFKFVVVAAKTHRGRLRATWDPLDMNGESIESNTNYTYIFDLAEKSEFTIDISYMSHLGYLNTETIVDKNVATSIFIGPHVGQSNDWNGTLNLSVVDPVTGPSTDNNLQILIFASMTDDAQFMSPTDQNIKDITYWTPQAFDEFVPQSGDMEQSHDTKPMCTDPDVVFGTPKMMDERIYCGEHIVSVRSLVKRYCFVAQWFWKTGLVVASRKIWNLFGYRGNDPDGLWADGANRINYNAQTYLHYFIPCYGGWSGSLRYKYFSNGGQNRSGSDNHSVFSFSRLSDSPGFSVSVIPFDIANTDAVTRFYASEMSDTINGSVITPIQHKSVLETEVPFYSNLRFFPGRKLTGLFNTNFTHSHKVTAVVAQDGASDSVFRPSLEYWIAAGEDFTASFWLGVPRCYKQAITPF